jgi:galactose-1-phosphate uridylyltransferase
MAELRKEPIASRWVLITTEHPRGPADYLPFKPPYQPQETRTPCPFCPGNEAMTPGETFSWRPDGKGWAVRVVPNKFPFFRIEGDFDRRLEGMYDLMEAIGAHEIVVETPDHSQSFATLEPYQIEGTLIAFQDRLIDLAKDSRFRYFLVFCPFASRYPFETWIIPKVHSADFHKITREMRRDLAVAIQSLFARFHQLLSDPPYSLVLHTSPVQRFHRDEYHWHFEIRLRIGLREGFEWATGFFVNPTPPENGAAFLREAG